mmetsp:Transcript_5347/g.7454  ORF Transcript_5347/g.7454 Transcript_5347/m.7454 type:complete len:213 (-) Transcript_5347:460-1098(-)
MGISLRNPSSTRNSISLMEKTLLTSAKTWLRPSSNSVSCVQSTVSESTFSFAVFSRIAQNCLRRRIFSAKSSSTGDSLFPSASLVVLSVTPPSNSDFSIFLALGLSPSSSSATASWESLSVATGSPTASPSRLSLSSLPIDAPPSSPSLRTSSPSSPRGVSSLLCTGGSTRMSSRSNSKSSLFLKATDRLPTSLVSLKRSSSIHTKAPAQRR